MFGWFGSFNAMDRATLEKIANRVKNIDRDVIEIKGRIETGMTLKEQAAITKKLRTIAARLRFISVSKP